MPAAALARLRERMRMSHGVLLSNDVPDEHHDISLTHRCQRGPERTAPAGQTASAAAVARRRRRARRFRSRAPSASVGAPGCENARRMAVPRLPAPAEPAPLARRGVGQLSDEVELYQRTYTTLLRSSGETRLRILEPSHAAMRSSLHAHAGDARARPRRLPLRAAPPAPGRLEHRRRGHGPGQARLRPRRPGRHRALDAGRGGRPPPALVRLRRRHDGGAAGLDVGPRRPAADARRLPDRVEQARDAGPRRGCPPRRRGPRPGGAGRDDRRHRLGLGTRRRGVARRPGDLPRRGARAPHEPPDPDARRLARGLRPPDAPVVAARAPVPRRRRPRRRAGLLRLLEHALARQPPHGHRARARGRGRRPRRARGPRGPARGAPPPPGRPDRGLVGELPLLRRARAVRRPARGQSGVAAPRGARARDRHPPPGLPDRAARRRRRSWTSRAWTPPGWTRGSATSTPRAWPPPTR